MEEMFSAGELIEGVDRSRCETQEHEAVQSGKWIRQGFLYVIIFLILLFPVFA